uniref:Wiskott-Aldrich syndrome protein family member n=1 Tax=Plectus sambesii TaxID=2011161 RepID=A0A914V6S2_9BILA
MPASFRLVEPTSLYARSGQAKQDSLTDVRHDGLLNLIRQMASLQRHAADIFAGVADEILLIDERCGRLCRRITELDERATALPNPIKTKITCAGSISRYTDVKHHFRSSLNPQVVFKQSTFPERPAHLMAAYRAAANGRMGPAPMFETAATQTDIGRPTPTRLSDRQSQSAPTPSPTKERSISPPMCRIDIVTVDISGRPLKRAQDSRSKWPQTIVGDQSPYGDDARAKVHNNRVSSSTPISQVIDQRERSTKKASESPAPLSPTDVDIYDWHAKDDFDYDYLPFQRKKTNTMLHDVYASLRRPKKRRSLPTERNSSHRNSEQSEDTYKSVDADNNSTDSPDDSGGKTKTVLRRSLSLRRVRRQKKPSSEIVYEELPFLLERDRLLHEHVPSNTDSVVSFKELSRRKLCLPISTSSQVIHLATTLMSNERKQRGTAAGQNEIGQPEEGGGRRPASVLSINSNASLGLPSIRMAHDGFYRRGYQLDSPDAMAVGVSSQSSPRDPVGESPEVRSTADSSYSCDHEGYFTSMHKDSGLTVPGQAGALADRHSTLSATDPTKPRGDSSGDSGAEDLQEACSDDKQRVEKQNTAVTAPTQKTLLTTSGVPSAESRPNIIRPRVIDTFTRNDAHRSTLPRQSRQPTTSLRSEDVVEGKELDEWLLHKFQTEMIVKSRARSASAQRMPASQLHPTQSFQSSADDDRQQQFAQAMSIRKAVRFCE